MKCQQYHDTVREELEDILSKVQEIDRKQHPGHVMLFWSRDFGSTLTLYDVAKETQSLVSQFKPEREYHVLRWRSSDIDAERVGTLHTKAKQGQIDVSYEGSTQWAFNIKVGFGGRVMDYEMQGTDGNYRSNFSKDNINAALEQILTQ